LGSLDRETAFDAAVWRAKAEQQALLRSSRTCSAAGTQLGSVDREAGDQIRLYRTDDQCAVYTVVETRDEPTDSVVRMGLRGRNRVGTTDSFDGVLEATVPHPELSETAAREQTEFIERLTAPADATVAVLSPHGGMISPSTDAQADTVADELSTEPVRWGCQGWSDDGSAFDRWYISSLDISPASFPELARITDRPFDHVVSFRGLDDQGVYISGFADSAFIADIAAGIESTVDSSVSVITNDRPTAERPDGGAIAHRLAASDGASVWIGQHRTVREDHGDGIATAVADAIESTAV
jgi:hypothetical protein